MRMNRGAVWLVAAGVAMRMNHGGHPSHGVAFVSRLVSGTHNGHLGHCVVSVSGSTSGIRSVDRSPPWPVLLSSRQRKSQVLSLQPRYVSSDPAPAQTGGLSCSRCPPSSGRSISTWRTLWHRQ
ncbi:hypothetical protein SDJN03_17145, partial [Cucurbita argyrosperma subsp. sororia]